MRFRRSSRGSHRSPRPQTTWFRQRSSLVLTTGTLTSLTMFAPSTFQSGTVDNEMTVLRVKLLFEGVLVLGAGGNSVPELLMGVYVDPGTILSDPSMAAAADQRQDWMTLGSVLPEAPLITPQVVGAANWSKTFDIRAKRKLSQEDQLLLGIKPTFQTNGGSFTLNVVQSILFQLTRRR